MKRSTSIQLKAGFLLIVFSLNIILVFACSVGINMGYNTSHHPEEKAAIIHNHDKSHHEQEKAEVSHKHNKAHSHNEIAHNEIADNQQSQKSKDDCCSDEAEQFSRMDKLAPKSLDFNMQPVFFTPFFSSSNQFDIFETFESVSHNKYFVRGHHPPIPEIRIAIQSFQI